MVRTAMMPRILYPPLFSPPPRPDLKTYRSSLDTGKASNVTDCEHAKLPKFEDRSPLVRIQYFLHNGYSKPWK